MKGSGPRERGAGRRGPIGLVAVVLCLVAAIGISLGAQCGIPAGSAQGADARAAAASGAFSGAGAQRAAADSVVAAGADDAEGGISPKVVTQDVRMQRAAVKWRATREVAREQREQDRELALALKARDVSDEMTGKALKRVPSGDALEAFSLDDQREAPGLSEKQEKAIGRALDAIEDANCTCGLVFMDMRTGCGLACNADERIYTASAFKAAFVRYMIDRDGFAKIGASDRANASAAIRYSSNAAYDALALPRMGKTFTEWLKSYGIAFESASPYYPHATARSMARIWADIFQYLQTGTKGAAWFADLLADTNRSFIRDAVGGKGTTVYNKAGWIAEGGDYSAVTDCAYIDASGRPYLMVVLTDQASSTVSHERAEAVAKALFAARKSLA